MMQNKTISLLAVAVDSISSWWILLAFLPALVAILWKLFPPTNPKKPPQDIGGGSFWFDYGGDSGSDCGDSGGDCGGGDGGGGCD